MHKTKNILKIKNFIRRRIYFETLNEFFYLHYDIFQRSGVCRKS